MLVDPATIRPKLGLISEHLKILQEIKNSTAQSEYLEDRRQQLIVERLLHLIVEAAIDINNHVVVRIGQSPSEDYYGSFAKAARVGLISSELATQLAPSAGLRNRLVHDYDDLDNIIIYNSIEFALVNYAEYILQVQRYIKQKER